MRRNRIPVLATLVALFALVLPTFIPSGLFAYELNSYSWPLGNPGQPVLTIIVDDRGHPDVHGPTDRGVVDTVDAINSSTDSWNSTPMGTMVEAVAGDAVTDFGYGDGTPMVRFDDPDSKCTGNCLAIASTSYKTSTSRITDSDITFNDDHNWITRSDARSAFCPSRLPIFHYIENVIVHEVGHSLGLGHSSVSGATMYPETSECKTNLITIESDDSRGLRDLYTGNPSCVAISAKCQSSSDCCLGGCIFKRCILR